MDYITYGLFLLAGGLISYLIFNRGPGPFERTIWHGLYQGKRVVVSIDSEAFIFEMNGNRLRITRGTSDYLENSDDTVASSMDRNSTYQSNDSNANGI